jgi:uncharacterized protein (DUF427 family)
MSSTPEWAKRARLTWHYRGQQRPPFAVVPGPGQESVWDYPRPPRLEPDNREVIVCAGVHEIARTRRAMRLLETASPPGFYLPPDDVRTEWLSEAPGISRCEWKGEARYWSVNVGGRVIALAAWSYPSPPPEYDEIRGWFAFYPSLLECFVASARALAQPGRFYGGWITPEVAGPFKGEPGSEGW